MSLDSGASHKTHAPGVSAIARRINTLARELGARRYLEIGVCRGKTFLAVEVPNKVAVDPRFQFDVASHQTDCVRFYAMPSDEWFVNHSSGEAFDIIFIDGLHTFEQTFRDFCNSLVLSHQKTVWVIDDTMPHDFYSAWPDHKIAVELRRKEMGGKTVKDKGLGGWNGDVFKVVFAIHDFFPTLSYRTVVGGKPQTIVWRRPRVPFAPLFNNLERISRLTYFDFQGNLQLFQCGKEDEILQEVFSWFAERPALPALDIERNYPA